MAKKAILIAFALLFLVNLSIYSKQTTEQKIKQIDLQIAKYTRQRNIGIGLCAGGTALEVLGTVLASLAIYGDYSEPAYRSGLLWGSGIMLIGVLPIAFGSFMWISGAIAVYRWESRKFDYSLNVQGPDLSNGKKLGEVSIVCSY